MKNRVGVLLVLTVLIFGTVGSASAGQLFMSAASTARGLEKCDTLHHEQTCDRYHVVGTQDEVTAGVTLTLNDAEYRVTWAGIAYRLENGTVVSHSNGAWQQVFPTVSPVSGSSEWVDNDGDKALSISDSVTVNGVSSKIKDVRFYLWVEPVQ